MRPMTAGNLKDYKDKVDASFVMKDLHKYRDMPAVLHKNPQFFTTYPDLLAKAAKTLRAYKQRLDESFVMKDLHKYRDMPQVLHSSPQFFSTYPELVTRAAKTMFTVDGVDKKTKQREIFGSFKAARHWRGLVKDAYSLWRAFR